MADKNAASAAAKGDQVEKKAEKEEKKTGKKKEGLFTKARNFFGRIGKYLKDTRSELKRSSGPAKNRSASTPSPFWSSC